MQQFIKEIARGKRGSTDLTYEQAKEAARLIASGQATDAQVAAFLLRNALKPKMQMNYWDSFMLFVKKQKRYRCLSR